MTIRIEDSSGELVDITNMVVGAQPPGEYASSIDWLREALARVRYKPGYVFSVESPSWAFPNTSIASLMIEATLPNARRPGEIITIRPTIQIPPSVHKSRDLDVFRRWLLDALDAFEEHETREWFSFDGELVNDPHHPDNGPEVTR